MMGLRNKTILMVSDSHRIGKTCVRFLLITNANAAFIYDTKKELANKSCNKDGSVLWI